MIKEAEKEIYLSSRRPFIRTISAVVVLAFIFQDLSFAQSMSGGIWSGAQKENVIAQTTVAEAGMPKDIHFSKSLVGFQEKNLLHSNETIVHLQDAHNSLDAQRKINDILSVLLSEFDVRQIALEGSSGQIDTTLFKTYPDQQKLKEVSWQLVEKGLLNAGELFAINAQTPVEVVGAEARTLYREDLKVFRDLMTAHELIRADLEWLQKALKTLSERIDQKPLRDVKALLADFNQDKTDFIERWKTIRTIAAEKKLGELDGPNLKLLDEVTSVESGIEFSRANDQRARLLSDLKARAPQSVADEILKQSLDFKAGKLTELEFHRILMQTAAAQGLTTSNYPDLGRFVAYLEKFDRLDLAALIGEMEILKQAIKKSFLTTADERALDVLMSKCEVIADLVSGSASSPTYNEWVSPNMSSPISFVGDQAAQRADSRLKHAGMTNQRASMQENSKLGSIVADLERLCEQTHTPYYPAKFERIGRSLPLAERFYRLAQKRDRVMVDKTLKAMRQSGRKVGVLVTGGFHKQGISRILRDSRVSSLVLTPRIDDASKTRPYVTILTRKKADYEKTFSKPASKYQIMIGTLLDNAGAARIGPDQTRQLLEPMVASLVKNSADVSKALNRWMADYRRAWAAQARPNRHLSPAKVESVAMGLAAARLSATASAATLPVVERALEQIQIDKVITMDAQGNLNLSRVVSNEELFKDISTGELPVVIRQLSDWTTTAELTLSGSGTSAMTLEEKIQKLTYLAVAYRMLADLHVRAAKPEEAQKTFVKKMYTFQEQISKLLFEANVPEDLLKLEPTQKLESTIELDSAIRLDQMHGFAPDLVYLYWPILRNTLLMNIPVHVYPINQWSLREESQDGGIASRLMDTPPFTVKLFPEAEPVIRITFKDSSSDQTRDEHSISIGVDQAEDIFRGIEDPQHPFYSYRVVLKVLTLVGIAKSAATAKRDLEAFFKSQGGKGIHLVEENWAPNRSGTGGSQNAAMAILRVMITGLCGKTIQAGTAGILQLAYLTQYLEQSLGIRGGLQDSIASHKGGGLIFHFSGLDSPELDVIASLEGGRKMLDNILVDTILVDVRGEHEASKVLEDLTDGFYRRDRHFLESVQASRARMEKMQKILKGTHSDDDLMLKDPDGRYETDRQGRLIKLSREEMLKNLFVEDYYYFRQLYGFKNPELDRLYQDSELRKLTGTVKVRRRLASGGFEIIEINRIKAHGAEGNLLSIFGKPFQGREAIYRWWLGHRHGNGQAYFAGFASQGSTLIMKAGARLGETTMTDDTIHELALRIAVSGSPHDVILQPDPSTALVAKELTFLIKPNIARDEENLKKILRRLRNEQLYVAGAAVFDGAAPEMLVKIRQHYSRIYEYAYHGSAVMNRADKEKLGLIYDNERFVGAFGCPFAAVPVLGAFEAMNRFNLSQEQITALWSQTQQDVARYRTGRVDGINQIGPNLSVMVVRDPAINDGKPFFLVNGYYFDLIRPFLAPGNKTVALLLRQKVGARMSDLKTKRELLLGSSDPARAAEGSLRREAWMNQFRTIGAVTAAANGFHMNDSDLAAAREAKIWFGIDYLSTRLGLLLYQYGYSRRDIEYLASADFMASSGVDLFQLTENMDSKQALAVIRSVWKPYYGDPLSPPALPTMSLTAYRRLARAHDRGRLNAGTHTVAAARINSPTQKVLKYSSSDAPIGNQKFKDGKVGEILLSGGTAGRMFGYQVPEAERIRGMIRPFAGSGDPQFKRRTAFELQAGHNRWSRQQYGGTIPLWVFSTALNRGYIERDFDKHHDFGLSPGTVFHYSQGEVPRRNPTREDLAAAYPKASTQQIDGWIAENGRSGGVFFDDVGRPSYKSLGHLDAVNSLVLSGEIFNAIERGIEYLYFIDNTNLGGYLDPGIIDMMEREKAEFAYTFLPKSAHFEITGEGLPEKTVITVRGGQIIRSNLPSSFNPILQNGQVTGVTRDGQPVSVKITVKVDKVGSPVDIDGKTQVLEGILFPAGFDQSALPYTSSGYYVISLKGLARLYGIDYSKPRPMSLAARYNAVRRVTTLAAVGTHVEVKDVPVDGQGHLRKAAQFSRLLVELGNAMSSVYLEIDPDARLTLAGFLRITQPSDIGQLQDILLEHSRNRTILEPASGSRVASKSSSPISLTPKAAGARFTTVAPDLSQAAREVQAGLKAMRRAYKYLETSVPPDIRYTIESLIAPDKAQSESMPWLIGQDSTLDKQRLARDLLALTDSLEKTVVRISENSLWMQNPSVAKAVSKLLTAQHAFGRAQYAVDGGEYLKKTLGDKVLVEVAAEWAWSPEMFEAYKDFLRKQQTGNDKEIEAATRRVAMAFSAGGIGPLIPERAIALSQMGMDVIGFSLLHKYVWVQYIKKDGSVDLRREFIGDDVKKFLEAAGEVSITMKDGKSVKVKAWRMPAGMFGKAQVYLLEPPDEVLFNGSGSVMYAGSGDVGNKADGDRARENQNWVLGRGGLAYLKKVSQEGGFAGRAKPVTGSDLIIVMSEVSAMFADPKLVKDKLADDPFFDASIVVFNDHTPLDWAHPKLTLDELRVLGVNPLYYENISGLVDRGTSKVDIVAMLANSAPVVYGVSERHGEVMRAMTRLDRLAEKIRHVTNGVRDVWAAPEWRDPVQVAAMSDRQLLDVREQKRQKMIRFIAEREGLSQDWVREAIEKDFAFVATDRRIVMYKRLDLVAQMVEDPRAREAFLRMNQVMIFGGRIHQDEDPWGFGKQTVARILQAVKDHPELKGRILFFENYNVYESPELKQGVQMDLMFSVQGEEAAATGHDKARKNGALIGAVDDGSIAESVVFLDDEGSNLEEANGFLVGYSGKDDKGRGSPALGDFMKVLIQFNDVYRYRDTTGVKTRLAKMTRNAIATSQYADVRRTALDMLNLFARSVRREDQIRQALQKGRSRADVVIGHMDMMAVNTAVELSQFRFKTADGGDELRVSAPGIRPFTNTLTDLSRMGLYGQRALIFHAEHICLYLEHLIHNNQDFRLFVPEIQALLVRTREPGLAKEQQLLVAYEAMGLAQRMTEHLEQIATGVTFRKIDAVRAQRALDKVRQTLGLSPNGNGLTYDEFNQLDRWYSRASDENRRRLSQELLEILYDENAASIYPQTATGTGVLDGALTLDLHMHLTYDLRTKRYTLDGYFVQPGNTGANVARSQSSGKTPSVFVGVSSGFEQRVLLRKLASTLGRVQAKIAKGQGRVSMYWHIPSQASAGIASVYAFTPAQPVLTAEQGDELLARLQRLPVSVDKQFFVVSGRVFSGLDGGYYLRAFKILRVKGYRIAADIKQYQTSDEIRLIAAAGPDLLLLNTRELATLYNASRSGPMRYQAEQTAQRAYDVAKENNIPMVVVSLEEKGAVAIFPSDTSHGSSYQAWRATLAPLSANGDWEAADDALLAGLIHELSLRPEQYLPAMRRALAARAVNAIFSGPVTVRVTDTRVEPLLEQVQFKQIALVFQKGLTNAARLAQRKPIGTPRVMAVETLDGRRLMAGGAAATSAGEIAKNLSVGGALVGQGQIPQTEALKDAADALAAAHQANVPKVQTLAEGEATAQEFKTMVSQLQTRVAGGQELITYQKTAVPALLHSLTGVDFTQPISDADMTAIQNGPAGQVSAKFFYDDSGALRAADQMMELVRRATVLQHTAATAPHHQEVIALILNVHNINLGRPDGSLTLDELSSIKIEPSTGVPALPDGNFYVKGPTPDDAAKTIQYYDAAEDFRLKVTASVKAAGINQMIINVDGPNGVLNGFSWQELLSYAGLIRDPNGNLRASNGFTVEPIDVNRDGLLTPLDVLTLISFINNRSSANSGTNQFPPEFDVNGDQIVSPLDVLITINAINMRSQSTQDPQAVTKYLEALYDYQFSLINDPHAAEIDRVITQMYGYSLLNLTPDAMFAYGNLLFASNGQPVSIPGNLQYLYTAEQFQDGLWHRTGTDGSWIDTSIARLIGQSQGILHGYTQTNIGRVNTILYGDNGQPRPIGPTLDYLRSISTGMLPVKTADPATIARGATAFVQAPNGLGVVLGQRDLVTGQIKYSVGSSVVIQNTKINIAALPISNEQKQELWFGVYRMLFDNNFYWTDQFKQSGTNTFELYIPAEMPYLSEANWQRLVTDINRLYDEKGMRVELVLFGGQYDPATNNNRQAILDATKKAAQALAGCRGVVSVKLFNEPDRFLPGQQGAIDEPWAVINMTLQQLYDFAGQQAEILHAYCPDLIVLLGTSSNLTADMMYAMRVENVDKFFNGFGTNAYPGGVNGNIPADEIPRGYGNLVDFAAGIGLPIVFSEMGVTVTSTLDYQASFASLLLSGAQTFMYGGAASAGERIVPRVTWYQGPPQEWQGADATMAVFIRNPDDSFSKKPVWDSIATAYDHMNDLIAPLANGARLASARKPNEPAGQPAHPKHFKRKRAKRVPTVTAQTGGARLALDIGKVTELFRNEAVAPLAAALLEKAQIEALAGIKGLSATATITARLKAIAAYASPQMMSAERVKIFEGHKEPGRGQAIESIKQHLMALAQILSGKDKKETIFAYRNYAHEAKAAERDDKKEDENIRQLIDALEAFAAVVTDIAPYRIRVTFDSQLVDCINDAERLTKAAQTSALIVKKFRPKPKVQTAPPQTQPDASDDPVIGGARLSQANLNQLIGQINAMKFNFSANGTTQHSIESTVGPVTVRVLPGVPMQAGKRNFAVQIVGADALLKPNGKKDAYGLALIDDQTGQMVAYQFINSSRAEFGEVDDTRTYRLVLTYRVGLPVSDKTQRAAIDKNIKIIISDKSFAPIATQAQEVLVGMGPVAAFELYTALDRDADRREPLSSRARQVVMETYLRLALGTGSETYFDRMVLALVDLGIKVRKTQDASATELYELIRTAITERLGERAKDTMMQIPSNWGDFALQAYELFWKWFPDGARLSEVIPGTQFKIGGPNDAAAIASLRKAPWYPQFQRELRPSAANSIGLMGAQDDFVAVVIADQKIRQQLNVTDAEEATWLAEVVGHQEGDIFEVNGQQLEIIMKRPLDRPLFFPMQNIFGISQPAEHHITVRNVRTQYRFKGVLTELAPQTLRVLGFGMGNTATVVPKAEWDAVQKDGGPTKSDYRRSYGKENPTLRIDPIDVYCLLNGVTPEAAQAILTQAPAPAQESVSSRKLEDVTIARWETILREAGVRKYAEQAKKISGQIRRGSADRPSFPTRESFLAFLNQQVFGGQVQYQAAAGKIADLFDYSKIEKVLSPLQIRKQEIERRLEQILQNKNARSLKTVGALGRSFASTNAHAMAIYLSYYRGLADKHVSAEWVYESDATKTHVLPAKGAPNAIRSVVRDAKTMYTDLVELMQSNAEFSRLLEEYIEIIEGRWKAPESAEAVKTPTAAEKRSTQISAAISAIMLSAYPASHKLLTGFSSSQHRSFAYCVKHILFNYLETNIDASIPAEQVLNQDPKRSELLAFYKDLNLGTKNDFRRAYADLVRLMRYDENFRELVLEYRAIGRGLWQAPQAEPAAEGARLADAKAILEASLEPQMQLRSPVTAARLADSSKTSVSETILVGVLSPKVKTELAAAAPKGSRLAFFELAANLPPEQKMEALDLEARRIGAGYTIVVDDEDLNASAKRQFLAELDRADIATRSILTDLLEGRLRVEDLEAAQRGKIFDQIIALLPRIAPKSIWDGDLNRPANAEDAFKALRLQVFHPSFGYSFDQLVVEAPEKPRAAIWTPATILEDPFFFQKLDDRDQKLGNRMRIDDHVIVTQSDAELKSLLGDRYEAFLRRFGSNIHRTASQSLDNLYQEIPALARYQREHVLFVDMEKEQSLRQDAKTQDRTLKMLLVRGTSITTDKMVVVILASPTKLESILPKGLTRMGNLFILAAIKPIDYGKQFAQYYQQLVAVGTAA